MTEAAQGLGLAFAGDAAMDRKSKAKDDRIAELEKRLADKNTTCDCDTEQYTLSPLTGLAVAMTPGQVLDLVDEMGVGGQFIKEMDDLLGLAVRPEITPGMAAWVILRAALDRPSLCLKAAMLAAGEKTATIAATGVAEKLEAELAARDKHIAVLHERYDQLDQEITELRAFVKAKQNRLDESEDKVTTLQGLVDRQAASLAIRDRDVRDLAAAGNRQARTIGELQKMLADPDLLDNAKAREDRLVELKTNQSQQSMASQIRVMDEQMHDRVATLEGRIADLKTTRIHQDKYIVELEAASAEPATVGPELEDAIRLIDAASDMVRGVAKGAGVDFAVIAGMDLPGRIEALCNALNTKNAEAES